MGDAERIQGSRISPVGVVEEKGKIRVIHDLTFEGPRSNAGGDSRRSVNVDTDWERDAILQQIVGLRANIEIGARILIQKMNVNSGDRRASAISHKLLGNFVLSTSACGSFGKGARGGGGLCVGAIRFARSRLSRMLALDSPATVWATVGVAMTERTGYRWPIYRLDVRYRRQRVDGRMTQCGPHDAISVQVQ